MKEFLIKIISVFQGGGTRAATEATEKLGKSADRTRRHIEEFQAELLKCWKKTGILAGGVAALAQTVVNLGVGAVQGAVASIVGMGRAFAEGVKSAADYAGKMSDLSAQTGQSVEDTMLLVQAFRNAGLGGESAGQAINLLQRALAGVNEEGKPTKEVFDKLGLSQERLRNMSATAALQEIAAAIAGLGTDADRTQAAMDLFGRSGGRMLALLKDTEAFSTARTQLGGLAAALGSSSGDLDKFSDAIGSMDLKGLQFYAAFASTLAGDLGKAADAVNRLDLSTFGTQLGLAVRGATDLAQKLGAAAEAAAKLAPGDDKNNVASAKLGLGIAAETMASTGPGGGIYQLVRLLQHIGTDSLTQERLAARDAETANKPQPMDAGWSDAEIDAFEPVQSRQDEIDAFEPVTAPDDDPTGLKAAESARLAAEKSAQAEAAKAAKREELELELQLAEARATGNTEEEKRLEWMREYNRLLEEGRAAGMGENAYQYAIRGANSKDPAAGDKDADPRWAQSASAVQAGSLTQTVARLIGANTKPADKTADVAANTKRIADRQEALIALIEKQEVDTFAV